MHAQSDSINPFEAIVYSDGSQRPKEGDASWACHIILYDNELEENHYLRHGRLAYNNNHLAELHAAFMGVKTALSWGVLDIEVNTDSHAVLYLMAANNKARLLKGEAIAWRVAHLKTWATQAQIKWQYIQSSHNPQTLHGRVDHLCRLAYEWTCNRSRGS